MSPDFPRLDFTIMSLAHINQEHVKYLMSLLIPEILIFGIFLQVSGFPDGMSG